ncbi:MAG: PH domain-containing protein, partial [Candidatus Methanomethylicia archaeon]
MLKLLPNESLRLELKPHPLVFWKFYCLSFYFLFLAFESVYWKALPIYMYEWISRFIPSSYNITAIVLFLGSFIAVAVIIGLLEISLKLVILLTVMGVLGVVIVEYFNLGFNGYTFIYVIYSILIIGLTDIYRKAHKYYITNFRIVSAKEFITHEFREVTFDKISDIVLKQGVLGRVFGFGSLIPITTSGFGLGSDFSIAGGGILSRGVGVGIGGGKSVNIPRGRSYFILYGVRKPREVLNLISQIRYEYIEAPYLRKISQDLERVMMQVAGTKLL